jgi:3-dehydroquinate synthase
LESYISKEKNLISDEEFVDIKSTINTFFEKITFTQNDIQEIIKLLIHDKKNEYGKVQFVLLNSIGNIVINQLVENQLIENSFENYIF